MLDCIGKKSVSAIIEQSGLGKFTIYRGGATKATPVFEYLEGTTSRQSQLAFEAWANTILAGNPGTQNAYEMMLFNDLDAAEPDMNDMEDVEMQPRGKKNKGSSQRKSSKMKFSFCLTDGQIASPTISGAERNQESFSGYMTKKDAEAMVTTALKEQREAGERNQILERLGALEDMLNDQEDEAEELGEPQPDVMDKIERLVKLASLQGMAKKPVDAAKAAPAVNGVDEQKKANINKAINILFKHDPSLDTDLLKLAEVAEKDTDQFNLLLGALRRM